jgi:hypothetical protein
MIISSAFGSSRASPILACPQPNPSKKIRMLSALFFSNMDLISSRASSVILIVITPSVVLSYPYFNPIQFFSVIIPLKISARRVENSSG